jgi:hypothetical protein
MHIGAAFRANRQTAENPPAAMAATDHFSLAGIIRITEWTNNQRTIDRVAAMTTVDGSH